MRTVYVIPISTAFVCRYVLRLFPVSGRCSILPAGACDYITIDIRYSRVSFRRCIWSIPTVFDTFDPLLPLFHSYDDAYLLFICCGTIAVLSLFDGDFGDLLRFVHVVLLIRCSHSVCSPFVVGDVGIVDNLLMLLFIGVDGIVHYSVFSICWYSDICEALLIVQYSVSLLIFSIRYILFPIVIRWCYSYDDYSHLMITVFGIHISWLFVPLFYFVIKLPFYHRIPFHTLIFDIPYMFATPATFSLHFSATAAATCLRMLRSRTLSLPFAPFCSVCCPFGICVHCYILGIHWLLLMVIWWHWLVVLWWLIHFCWCVGGDCWKPIMWK